MLFVHLYDVWDASLYLNQRKLLLSSYTVPWFILSSRGLNSLVALPPLGGLSADFPLRCSWGAKMRFSITLGGIEEAPPTPLTGVWGKALPLCLLPPLKGSNMGSASCVLFTSTPLLTCSFSCCFLAWKSVEMVGDYTMLKFWGVSDVLG
jgi:hypothetical protein